jgi:hypothetical protein
MIAQLLIMYRVGQGKAWTADVTSMNSSQTSPRPSKTLELRFAKRSESDPTSSLEFAERGSSNSGLEVTQVSALGIKVDAYDSQSSV